MNTDICLCSHHNILPPSAMVQLHAQIQNVEIRIINIMSLCPGFSCCQFDIGAVRVMAQQWVCWMLCEGICVSYEWDTKCFCCQLSSLFDFSTPHTLRTQCCHHHTTVWYCCNSVLLHRVVEQPGFWFEMQCNLSLSLSLLMIVKKMHWKVGKYTV